MGRFTLSSTPLHGLVAIERQPLRDTRGFLARLFCAEELASAGWHWPIAQINHTHTAQRGMVRGLHYQCPPAAEAKLVTCLHGAAWDVVVDVRANSPTFLQWHAQELSASNHAAFLIPPGCAHGFQALEDGAELLYLHSAPYTLTCEAALNVRDPRLDIAWPLPIADLSPRDAAHPMLDASFSGVCL